MEIRVASPSDQNEIISLYARSQAATELPNPIFIPQKELGQHLYARKAMERYVTTEAGKIIGHALIEPPNPAHVTTWRQAVDDSNVELIEMGGAFVEPTLSGRGIWTALLLHRIEIIRRQSAVPVTATWAQNEHVKRTLLTHGGVDAGVGPTPLGEVRLFVF